MDSFFHLTRNMVEIIPNDSIVYYIATTSTVVCILRISNNCQRMYIYVPNNMTMVHNIK
jgi:hypothetical protein